MKPSNQYWRIEITGEGPVPSQTQLKRVLQYASVKNKHLLTYRAIIVQMRGKVAQWRPVKGPKPWPLPSG